ncbi:MaoC family dehydratase N-terminal domain-containing protein [Embleya sp. NPDC005971]|uniref:FAS1-like dehydratase domain-containing protein n=1 Tax=Embleya sp. NPDC005971 TaxID=3156724 RepID=UPI0033C89D87
MTTDTTDTAELDALLRDCVARGTASVVRARHAVNLPMLDLWADALGDPNPVYRDASAAAATGRAGIVAPPTMIQAWTMPSLPALAATLSQVPGYAPYLDGETPTGTASDNPTAAAHRLLTAHGYAARAATRCRQEYHREARIGDHLTCESALTTVSARKRTALGPGYFVTTRMTFRDQDGAKVATVDWTVLCFRTPERQPPVAAAPDTRAEPPRPTTASGRTCRPLTAAPQVGDRTPVTTIPITPTFVIATAFATQDFYAAHHDADWTRTSLHRPGIFTNILATTGLVGGVVTDWAGPATRLLEVDLRLLAPNHTGDTLALDGVVTAVRGNDLELRVTGTNSLGPHVQAGVRAHLPA